MIVTSKKKKKTTNEAQKMCVKRKYAYACAVEHWMLTGYGAREEKNE